MKFEEKNAKYYKKSDCEKLQAYVYFLIDNGEVVYVGQTTAGIARPMAHRDKQFDSFYMKKCKPSLLSQRETEMILKYRPKYNGNFINSKNMVAISNLKKELWDNGYPIRTIFLQREIEKLGIEPFQIKYTKSFSQKDAKKLIRHIKSNWKTLEHEQDVSLQKVFSEDEKIGHYGFLYFVCDKVKLKDYCFLGAKSIKDLYYIGKITDKQIEGWRKEYDKI